MGSCNPTSARGEINYCSGIVQPLLSLASKLFHGASKLPGTEARQSRIVVPNIALFVNTCNSCFPALNIATTSPSSSITSDSLCQSCLNTLITLAIGTESEDCNPVLSDLKPTNCSPVSPITSCDALSHLLALILSVSTNVDFTDPESPLTRHKRFEDVEPNVLALARSCSYCIPNLLDTTNSSTSSAVKREPLCASCLDKAAQLACGGDTGDAKSNNSLSCNLVSKGNITITASQHRSHILSQRSDAPTKTISLVGLVYIGWFALGQLL